MNKSNNNKTVETLIDGLFDLLRETQAIITHLAKANDGIENICKGLADKVKQETTEAVTGALDFAQ